MPERLVTVGSSVGLHARPATLFVQAAAKQPVKVTIGRPGDEPVDAVPRRLHQATGPSCLTDSNSSPSSTLRWRITPCG